MSIIRSNNKKKIVYENKDKQVFKQNISISEGIKVWDWNVRPRAPGPQAPSGAHQRPGSEEDGDTSRTSPFYNFTNPNVYLRWPLLLCILNVEVTAAPLENNGDMTRHSIFMFFEKWVFLCLFIEASRTYVY